MSAAEWLNIDASLFRELPFSSSPLLFLLGPMVLLMAVSLGLAALSVPFSRYRASASTGLHTRVPATLRMPARQGWVTRHFLGWTGTRRWAMATEEDSIGIIGPPASGKTGGVLIPALLLWGGPAVSTSIKPDVLRWTAGQRRRLAREADGDVYVYAPTAPGQVEGVWPVRWSPLAACQDPRQAQFRVDALVSSAAVSRGVTDADHWRAGAASILRPYFHAAALHPTRAGDFRVVREWLARQEIEEPVDILRGLESWAGDNWADELEGTARTPERELGSFFSAARSAVAATSNPNVLASCSQSEFDAERFLLSDSTLYIVSPSEDQESVSPLISALITWLVTTAYDLHRAGRLQSRFLLSLDELPNIAPLPQVDSIASQGRGQGVTLAWAAQSLAQLRARFGEHTAEAIWSSTTAHLVFGGLTDALTLERASALIGDRLVRTTSDTEGAGAAGSQSSSTTRSEVWRPRLTVGELRGIKPGSALLLYRAADPYAVRTPWASRQAVFREIMGQSWLDREPDEAEAAPLAGGKRGYDGRRIRSSPGGASPSR